MFGKTPCPWCDRAKELLQENGLEYKYYDIYVDSNLEEYKKLFPGKKTVPQIARISVFREGEKDEYRNNTYIGGYEELIEWLKSE